MSRGKKLAQVFKKAEKLVIEKTDNGYWVTDSYLAFKLFDDEYKEFRITWSKHKNNPIIPENINGKGIIIKLFSDIDEIYDLKESIINKIKPKNPGYEVNFTSILEEVKVGRKTVLRRFFTVNNKLGLINNDYYEFIKSILIHENLEFYSEKSTGLIEISTKDKRKLIGMLAPIRIGTDKKEEYKKLFKEELLED